MIRVRGVAGPILAVFVAIVLLSVCFVGAAVSGGWQI